VCHAKRGAAVRRGEALAEVHARDEAAAEAGIAAVAAAYVLGDDAVPPRPILLEVLG
jgi:thymidine phosphorylase